MGGLLSSHIQPYDKGEGEGDELNQSENYAPIDAPDDDRFSPYFDLDRCRSGRPENPDNAETGET
jgi:hypothetical protein